MINVGIIGFGKMGKIRAEAIEGNGEYIVGVYDSNDKKHTYKNYSDYQTLIDDSDVIFICTPNQFNAPITIECLKKNKHVFL